MPHDVTINAPGAMTGASFTKWGITFYQWGWLVTVDGQVWVYTDWVDTNNPADEPALEDNVIDQIENSLVSGDLGGVAQNDQPGDYGGEQYDGYGDYGDYGDFGDDGALADGGGDDGGGESA